MKEKILLVLTGGTICTRTEGNIRTLKGSSSGVMLADIFEKSDSTFADSYSFETGKNFNVLSENMTVKIWNDILDYLRSKDLESYRGVIILHGTDTLAYTAALLSIMLKGIQTPFFLVSSNAPIDQGDDAANGNANFRCAAELIGNGINPGVYVPYRNISDGRMYLHLASRIIQSKNYSDDFESTGSIAVDGPDKEETEKINGYFSSEESSFEPLLYMSGIIPLKNEVLKIEPYVGLDYDAFRYDRFKAVLHGSYHSGTACVEKTYDSDYYSSSSVLHMIDTCSRLGVDVYMAPVKVEGEIYDTVPVMADYQGRYMKPLYGCTQEFEYARLVVLYSNPDRREELEKILFSGCFNEIIE